MRTPVSDRARVDISVTREISDGLPRTRLTCQARRMPSAAEIARTLRHAPRRPLLEAPDEPQRIYAIWLDQSGAAELSDACGLPIAEGLIYAGVCRTQPLNKHLLHRTIGSFTLMKNLAALFRDQWSLQTVRGKTDAKLTEDGRRRLSDWMDAHLMVSWAPIPDRRAESDVLALLDPPLRLVGWGAEITPLRELVRQQRAVLDRPQRGGRG